MEIFRNQKGVGGTVFDVVDRDLRGSGKTVGQHTGRFAVGRKRGVNRGRQIPKAVDLTAVRNVVIQVLVVAAGARALERRNIDVATNTDGAVTITSSLDFLVELILFHIREDLGNPAEDHVVVERLQVGRIRSGPVALNAKLRVLGLALLHHAEREGDIPLVVDTGGASTHFTRVLNGGEEQPSEHTNNGDNDQQFNQGETSSERLIHVSSSFLK